jgi:hypothetical protein
MVFVIPVNFIIDNFRMDIDTTEKFHNKMIHKSDKDNQRSFFSVKRNGVNLISYFLLTKKFQENQLLNKVAR